MSIECTCSLKLNSNKLGNFEGNFFVKGDFIGIRNFLKSLIYGTIKTFTSN